MKIFDVELSKEELENLSKDPTWIKGRWDLTKYAYSHNEILKSKYFYPSFWDIYVGLAHGIYPEFNDNDEILDPNVIHLDIDYYIYNREYKYKSFRGIKVLKSGNLFLYYKNKHKIKQKLNAKGTVVFPVHSNRNTEWKIDWEKYIYELKKLPEKFKPLLICLYYEDINKGLHNLFLKEGFSVTTAGNRYNKDFVKRFYDILSSVKYVTSNKIMSSTFYAIDFGLPFFLYGGEVSYKQMIIKDNFKIEEKKEYEKAKDKFIVITSKISNEQKEVADFYLGKNVKEDSRLLITFILYKEWLKAQLKKIKLKIEKGSLLKYKKYLLKESLNIPNHMTIEERLSIIKFCLNKENIAEIGSFLGGNTINIANVAKNVFAIDEWDRHPIENAFEKFKKNIKEFGNIKVLNGRFVDIYKKFDHQLDVLIIDGRHYTKTDILEDITMMFPKLKKGGIIIIHHYISGPFVKWAVFKTIKNKVKKINNLENLFVGVKVED